MSKEKTGMNKKRFYRKVCSCKYSSEKKVPATVWILQRKLKILRRQYHSLEIEIQNVRDKNIELAKSVQIEKREQSRLKDEHYKLNSLYHNLSVNYNSTKEELIRTHQLITTLEDDLALSFTRLLKTSESITIAKSRIGEYFSFNQSKFQKDKEDGDVTVQHSLSPSKDNQNFRCGVPVKQRVGPMIKGYPITKPKIMLKRISVPVQQDLGDLEEMDSGDTSNDATAVPPLMTINEEEEVSGPELSGRQRRRTGFRYRIHQVRSEETDSIDTSNDATTVPSLIPVSEESMEEENMVDGHKLSSVSSRRRAGFRYRIPTISDARNNDSPTNINNEESASAVFTCDTIEENTNNCDMKPVVRLHDMNQMLIVKNTAGFEVNGPNSSLHIDGSDKTEEEKESNKVERRKYSRKESNAEGKGDISKNCSLKRPCEDPLEGCSWMYNSSSKQKFMGRKRRIKPKRKLYFEGRPSYSSDDSSDNDNMHEPNNTVHTPQVSKENIAVNSEAPNAQEKKVTEVVTQESFVCPYYDTTNPSHNSDKKLCNVCETCVTLQITTQPQLEVSKNIVECVNHVLLEPENSDSFIIGYSNKSNLWISNSSNKIPDNLAALPSKTRSLTPEENNSFRVSNIVHTSTPESDENPLSKGALPNTVLQNFEPKLTSSESACTSDNKNVLHTEDCIKDSDDSVDCNKNVKLKTSTNLCESVDYSLVDTSSENSVRKSERISLRNQHKEAKRILPTPNTAQRRSKRMSRSGNLSTGNESSKESLETTGGRPRRHTNKVSYKPTSLRKKLRRE